MELYKHQREAIDTLTRWEQTPLYKVVGGILAFKMGLGKTRTMLELIHREASQAPTLIICNKSNIQVWQNEIEKFYKNKLSFLILHPSQHKNCDTFSEDDLYNYNIVITTYEVARKQFRISDPSCFMIRENNFMPVEESLYRRSRIPEKYKVVTVQKPKRISCTKYTPIYGIEWRRIVTDEAQKFAGVNTTLCHAMIALKAHSYFCLSGTPVVNYSTDLYSLFRFMGADCLVKDWTKRYFFTMCYDSRILMKDYVDTEIKLPEMKMIHINVDLSEMEKKLYNEVVTQLKHQYNLFVRGQATFAAPLAMFTRLRQICVCSYILSKESKRNYKKAVNIENLKKIQTAVNDESINEALDDLANNEIFKVHEHNEWIKNINNVQRCSKIKKVYTIVKKILDENGKVIIFSSFVSVLDVLKRIFKKKFGECVVQMDGSVGTTKRSDIVKDFNANDDCKIFLSSYKAGGLGINLTGADNVVLMEPWWNTATEEQAICRSHRIGQTKPVTVYSLVAIPSFETYLLKVQERKNNLAKEFIDNYNQKYSRIDDSSAAKELIKHIAYGTPGDYYI